MSRDREIVAGLDLGTSRTCAVVAELLTDDRRQPGAKILGIGVSRPSGVRRGQVIDIEQATRAVSQALRDAERMAGVSVRRVICGVAPETVVVKTETGMGAIAKEEVSAADVERVKRIAREVTLGRDHELLHVIPQEFKVDDHVGIADPVGMTGLRLEAEVFLVGAERSTLQNLRKAVEGAKYDVDAFVLSTLAAGLAVLTEEERELGCALVDIGAGSTAVAIVQDRKVRHVASVNFAGAHVTNDLVAGLSVTQADAEQIKEHFGVAYEPLVDPDEMLDLPSTPGQGARQASRQLVSHIVHQRLEEIFQHLVKPELEGSGYAGELTAGLVLTGGTAHLPGLTELAREVFAKPVRLGEPAAGLRGLVDSVKAPRYAVPVGLTLYGAGRVIASSGLGVASGRAGPSGNWLAPVKRWLQDFF